MAILQGGNLVKAEGMDRETDTGDRDGRQERGKRTTGEMGSSDIGVMSANDEVLGMDRKKLGVMKSDDEGQTDAEVKDTDRLTGLGTDRQMLGPWAWRESLRVAGSAGAQFQPSNGWLQHVSANGDLGLNRLRPAAGPQVVSFGRPQAKGSTEGPLAGEASALGLLGGGHSGPAPCPPARALQFELPCWGLSRCCCFPCRGSTADQPFWLPFGLGSKNPRSG